MKLVPLTVGIVCLAFGVCAAETGEIMQDSDKYLDFVGSLIEEPPQSSEAVKEKVGVALRPISKDSKLRDEGSGTGADGLEFERVSLSYLPDGTPAVFVLTLAPEGAPSQDDVSEKFEGIKITAAPSGRSLDEEAEFSRKESWGTLAFGFNERNPDKLRSIIFNYIQK